MVFLTKTTTLRKDYKISDEEFKLLRDFIYNQTGIYIADNRKYLLETRLRNRLKELGLSSFSEYYYFLKYDPSRRKELEKLYSVVTTNETSFFRNEPQLKVFQNIILPEVINRKKTVKKLRIWSAGCSTGEEPYTIAIILHEVLKGEIKNWDIKITANDISADVIRAAKRGIYGEYSLRTTPGFIKARYFDVISEGRYKIKREVQQLVEFKQINLVDGLQIRQIDKSQVVFCRNVIIYFDDVAKKKVINFIYDNLEPGGYLFLGHSETLHNLSRAFVPKYYPGSIVYKKGEVRGG
ncbi:protein-glutamate O-methyltransferase CheR [Desulfothermus okinawensis JCM 13304]